VPPVCESFLAAAIEDLEFDRGVFFDTFLKTFDEHRKGRLVRRKDGIVDLLLVLSDCGDEFWRRIVLKELLCQGLGVGKSLDDAGRRKAGL